MSNHHPDQPPPGPPQLPVPPPVYGPPPTYVYAAPPRPTEPSAVTGMVLGIMSLAVLLLSCPISLFLAIPGLVVSNRSLAAIRASGGTLGGEGMTTAGRVTSVIGIVIGALVLVVALLYVGLIIGAGVFSETG